MSVGYGVEYEPSISKVSETGTFAYKLSPTHLVQFSGRWVWQTLTKGTVSQMDCIEMKDK
jgi:hypothetical protein